MTTSDFGPEVEIRLYSFGNQKQENAMNRKPV